jgi:hypothetical protein
MTPEQNLRRVLIDNTPRDRLVEVIAKHLFHSARNGRPAVHGRASDATPRDWYRAPLRSQANRR